MKALNTLTLAACGVLLLEVTPARAQNYDLHVDDLPPGLVVLDRARPPFPDTGIRTGQEGWVRVNFVVTPEGNVIDPIVIDSVGGVEFENSVRETVPAWTFEPPGEVHANVTADIRFEIHLGRDLATSNFMRRHRRIVRLLHNEENAEARQWIDETAELGGWNLYESTMLWLMIGRVEGVEGNDAGKLEAYRRAEGVNSRGAIKGDDRRELLRRTFELEMGQSQFAAADRTLRALKREPGNKKDLEELAALVAELETRLASDGPIAARATVFNPADSAEGRPLWTYVPARRTFSFAAPSGNVERFEVRCVQDRLEGPVETGKTWTLPDSAKNCRVFVFGDDGASFDFVEHPGSEPPGATAETSVALTDGLDR